VHLAADMAGANAAVTSGEITDQDLVIIESGNAQGYVGRYNQGANTWTWIGQIGALGPQWHFYPTQQAMITALQTGNASVGDFVIQQDNGQIIEIVAGAGGQVSITPRFELLPPAASGTDGQALMLVGGSAEWAWTRVPSLFDADAIPSAWTAQVYRRGEVVDHQGQFWVAHAATVAGDVPGTSPKWVKIALDDLTLQARRNELPDGGTTGQALAKKSAGDGDVEWVPITDPPPLSDDSPLAAGTADAGNALETSRSNHVHPAELPLALGTAGQVLAVNAGATAVEWATPAVGGTQTVEIGAAAYAALVTAGTVSATTLYLVTGP
jgi:hypothetical protein